MIAANRSALRAAFPFYAEKEAAGLSPPVYFDNAATTHKPQVVLDRLWQFYTQENANIHRGAYHLAHQASQSYEEARAGLANFIGAPNPEQCIFVRGTTEAINVVASGLSQGPAALLGKQDTILISLMEHHANLIPWQEAAARSGAELIALPMNAQGDIDMAVFQGLLEQHRPKILALCHISNVLGTINPIREMIRLAHAYHCLVLIDGAQAVPHLPIDVVDLDCDFYVFSAHKMYGPSGVGLLYGKTECLERLSPLLYGGLMIEEVSFAKSSYAQLPHRLEAGTPPIAAAIAFASAALFIQEHRPAMIAQEKALFSSLCAQLEQYPFIQRMGRPEVQAPLLSFAMAGVHPHDLATALDQQGIALRAGKHCAAPLFEAFPLPHKSSCRVSLALYNTQEEIDFFIQALPPIHQFFSRI